MKLDKKTLILAACVLGGAAFWSGRRSTPRHAYLPPSAGYAYQAPEGSRQREADAGELAARWQAMAQQAQAQAWLQAAYGAQGGYGGGSPADPYMGGNFYGNSHLGTAVSSSGDSGYIALGDGNFVSW